LASALFKVYVLLALLTTCNLAFHAGTDTLGSLPERKPKGAAEQVRSF
jgi:hypothetical protein